MTGGSSAWFFCGFSAYLFRRLKFMAYNMKKRHLLDDISKESKALMIPCFDPWWKDFKAGETILTYDSGVPKNICVLEKGSAKLQILNENGDIFLLENIREGDLFGELFSLPLDTFEYIVSAESDCRVMYVGYEHIIKPCENLCTHHSQFISNLFMMAAHKSQELSLHISLMHQNTIRQKLIAYLSYVSSSGGTRSDGSFDIPISLAELAEYLSVDRSAMMREIKAMKNDGLISGNRREFIIHY